MANAQKHKEYKLSNLVTTSSRDVYLKYKDDKTIQFTSLFIRTYATIEEVDRLLDVLAPDEYAYIVHDKDKLDNGEPKAKHIHILAYKKSRMRLTKLFTFSTERTHVEIPRSKKDAYEYLTHKNDPDKAKYDPSELHEYHAKDNTFAVTQQEARDNRNINLLDDICNLSRREMAVKYGADYIKNYQRYESFMRVVTDDEEREEADRLAQELNAHRSLDDMLDLQMDNALIAITYREALVNFLVDQFSSSGEFPSYRDFARSYYNLLRLWSASVRSVLDAKEGNAR